MIVGCVVQGNLRRNTKEIIDFLLQKFDIVILSTWKDDEPFCQDYNCTKIFNEKPLNPGLHNRNLQQLSTTSGINKAKEMGCDYVMKWRTDMLPLNLNIERLIEFSSYRLNEKLESRIVCLAFRNLTCSNDWFSSIPDLFSFGRINEMSMLWDDKDYDYNALYNAPNLEVLNKLNSTDIELVKTIWPTESQIYSRMKNQLIALFGNSQLTHEIIVKNYFYLIDISELGIIWFDDKGGFRSVYQSFEQNWWTVNVWRGKRKLNVVDIENIHKGLTFRIKLKLNALIIRYMKFKQGIDYKIFIKSRVKHSKN